MLTVMSELFPSSSSRLSSRAATIAHFFFYIFSSIILNSDFNSHMMGFTVRVHGTFKVSCAMCAFLLSNDKTLALTRSRPVVSSSLSHAATTEERRLLPMRKYLQIVNLMETCHTQKEGEQCKVQNIIHCHVRSLRCERMEWAFP